MNKRIRIYVYVYIYITYTWFVYVDTYTNQTYTFMMGIFSQTQELHGCTVLGADEIEERNKKS